MKAIVVYYSLEGNTKYIADRIAEYLRADMLRLKPVKDYPNGNVSKFFWGGKGAVFGEKPKLIPYDFEAAGYDVIIIGTPVWAGTFTPPVRTFIMENNLSGKKTALYACNSGGSAEPCFDKMKKELQGCDTVAVIEFANPAVNQNEENVIKIKEFCNNIRNNI